MPARPKIYIPLLILCIISLFWFLGAAPFNTRGEPREAVVAMSMLQDGNWILPVNNGDEIAFKPANAPLACRSLLLAPGRYQ